MDASLLGRVASALRHLSSASPDTAEDAARNVQGAVAAYIEEHDIDGKALLWSSLLSGSPDS